MLDTGEYTVGWICALPEEFLAAQEFLDEEHGQPEWRSPNDTNSYVLGAIGKHNVVIAVLPMGEYGTASAADVAINMLRSFPNVRVGLMVGIGGGAPRLPDCDVRLGDVVVSSPLNGQSGVFQYDYGKSIQEMKFQHTRSLNQPPQALLTALSGLRTQHEREGNGLSEAVDKALKKRPRIKRKYGRPPPDTDVLFRSEFVHVGGSCVSACDQNSAKRIQRPEREPEVDDDPAVHYGIIASANTLMKDALIRDALAAEKHVLCFEMEAAGLMNRFPCLVVRGICDYSDSHKSKEWQGFAAMVAAAYAKDLVRYLIPEMVHSEKKLSLILSDIQDTAKETKTIIKGIESRQHSQQKQATLDWLTGISFGAQHSDLLAKRQPGTCQWLLDSDEYCNWVGNSNEILFCPGIPGAGKTILSSIVIHDLETKFTDDSKVALAYIYCNFKNQNNQDVRMLLSSVLKQLCQQQPDVPDVIESLYKKHERTQSKPQVTELSNALETVAALFSRVYLVVDALDEWQEMESDRSLMLSELLGLQTKTRLNLFVTSRPIADIKRHFQECPSVEISAVRTDISLYVNGHQTKLPKFVGETPGLLENIKDTLGEASQGMFLIAQLYLEWLKTEISVRDLENTLAQLLERSEKNDLGQVLGKAYDETMERIDAQNARHKELARKVLSWISFAKDKLTTAQVQHALAVKDGDTRLNTKGMHDPSLMVSVCCGLIAVDEASGIIRLVHYTTQEYFEDNETRWFPDVQAYFTKQCLSYLLLGDFEEGALETESCWPHDGGTVFDRISEYPFYKYAALNWDNHARNISGHFPDSTRDLVLCFFDSGPNLDTAVEIIQRYDRGPCESFAVNGLHLAAGFGLYCLIETLLERHSLNAKDSEGQTALTWACAAGHTAAAKFLIEKSLACEGADLNVQDSVHGKTPLHHAAYKGHHEIVKLLLEHGAAEIKDFRGRTPIVKTIKQGHDKIFETLLKARRGRAEQILYAKEHDLLYRAVRRQDDNITQLLLDIGVGIDTPDEDGRTALLRVAKSEDPSTIRFALNKGADPNLQDNWGISSLMLVAQEGVQLLLEKGANPDLQDEEGLTALMYASKRHQTEKVYLLLGNDADPNLQDNQGNTALLKALRNYSQSRKPRTKIIRMLLEKGASVDVQDSKGRSPLMRACRGRNGSILDLILEKNPDLDSRDNEGKSALMYSRYSPSFQRLLIKRGASVDFQDCRGRTRLMGCVEESDLATSELIIERSKDLNLQDETGMNALDYAFTEVLDRDRGGRDSIRRLLIEKGVKANVYHQVMDLSIRCPSSECLDSFRDSSPESTTTCSDSSDIPD